MQAVEASEARVTDAIKDFTELRHYDLNNGRGRVLRWLHRLPDKSMAPAMAMFIPASHH